MDPFSLFGAPAPSSPPPVIPDPIQLMEARIDSLQDRFVDEHTCMACGKKVDCELICMSPLGDGPAVCEECAGVDVGAILAGDAFDLFGTPEKEDLPGLTESFLDEIYQGDIPEIYSRAGIIEQTTAHIENRLATVGFCILRDMPAWVYHRLGYIGSTLLKGYAKNPRTCKKPYQPKDDANCGSGIHAWVLQGQEGLDAECAIMPIECEGRSKKAIAARDEFDRANPYKVPLPYRIGKDEDGDKPYIMDVLRGVDASYRENGAISRMLSNSETELSLFWTDEKSGVKCKARLDILCDRTLGDVKKTKDLDRFDWQIKELWYHLQLGHYVNGARACGLIIDAAVLLPCEAFYPYRVAVWPQHPDDLEDACREAERYISLVKDSTLTGNWPNYSIPRYSQKLGRDIWLLSEITPQDLLREFSGSVRNNYR